MGNILATIKKFFSNKNTVTILGVLVGIGVLIFAYNKRIQSAVKTISIPYAKTTIEATGEITSNNIGTIDVLQETIKNNKSIITSQSDLISSTTPYCVTTGTSVPANAFFYTEQVVPCNTVANNPFKNMPDGYSPVELSVDIHSTYGNSMYPGDYIDLYVRMTDRTGTVVFGKFIEKIQIADVRDSKGTSVFLTSSTSEPSSLLFTVEEKYFILLNKAIIANDMGLADIEIIPVPGNATYTSSPGEMNVTSLQIEEEIEYYVKDVEY